MPTFLLGVYGYIAAAVIAAAASGWAVHAIDNGAYESLKAQAATQQAQAAAAALATYQKQQAAIQQAASDYANSTNDLSNRIANIQRTLHNVQAQTPLAADCKPDINRLHSLQSVVAIGNAAAAGQRLGR